MANVQERRNTSGTVSWRVQYRVDGKLTSTTLYDPVAAQEFADLVDRIGGAAARKVLIARDQAPRTMQSLADWMRTYVAGLDAVTAGTRAGYLTQINTRIAGSALGELPISAITRDAVVTFLADLDLSTKTKRNYQGLISAALGAAAERGLIPTNPARNIRIRQTGPVSSMTFLSPGELAILLAEIQPAHRPLVVFLAGTGLRWGEATALLVGDVDLDARVPVVRVNKAWKPTGHGKHEIGPPKTRAGVRTVSLPPEVGETIRPLVEGRRQDALLFATPPGNRVTHARFSNRVWRPALRRLAAEVDKDGNPIKPRLTKTVRIHDLRHTHASQLVAAGVPLNVVQKRLGHESITTTVDRYSHLAPDYLEVSAAAASLGLTQAVPAIEA